MALGRRALHHRVVEVVAVINGDEDSSFGSRQHNRHARVLDEGEPTGRRPEDRSQISVDDAAVDDDRDRRGPMLRGYLPDGARDAGPQRVVSLGAGHEIPTPGAGERQPLGVARLRATAELTAFPLPQPYLPQGLPLL